MIKIAIIEDDHKLLNELKQMIDDTDAFQCVSASENIGAFIEQLNMKHPPDVLILDIRLNQSISLDQLEKIRKLVPSSSILIYSAYNKSEYINKAFSLGAKGYLLKGKAPKEIMDVLMRISLGKSYVDPELSNNVISLIAEQEDNFLSENESQKIQSLALKPRELAVAKGILRGQTYQEIANELFLSLNTIRYYIKNLYKRFEVNSKYQLIFKLKRILSEENDT